jgi:hypothetical protein
MAPRWNCGSETNVKQQGLEVLLGALLSVVADKVRDWGAAESSQR